MILKKIIKFIERRKLIEDTLRYWKIEYHYISDLTNRFAAEVDRKEEMYNKFIESMKNILEACKNERSEDVLYKVKGYYEDYKNILESYSFPWVTKSDVRTLRKYYVVARHHKRYNLCEDYCFLMTKINLLNKKAKKLSIAEPFEYYYKLIATQLKLKEMGQDFE